MQKTILCLDDDPGIVAQLEAGLGADEYRVIGTSDLDEAFAIAVEEQPDLIMLEILLEQGDGLGWVHRVRSAEAALAGVPIVVVTSASRTPALYGSALQLGVAEYLTKPVLASQLVSSVIEYADSKNEAEPLELGLAADSPAIGSPRAGNLSDLPLPELLDRLHRMGRSGVLVVEANGRRTGIQLRNGSPVAVSVGRGGETFEEYLVRVGLITTDDLDKVAEQVTFGMGSPSEILIGLEAISEEAYDAAANDYAEEKLFRLFELRSGRYAFEVGKRLKASSALDIHRDAKSVIVQGVLEWSGFETIREALARHPDLFVADGRDIASGAESNLTEDQRSFLDGLAGDRRIADYAEAPELEQRMLYAFSITGEIDLSDDTVLMLDIELDEESAVPSDAPRARKDANEEAVRRAVRSRAESEQAPSKSTRRQSAAELQTAYKRKLATLRVETTPDAGDQRALEERVRRRLDVAYGHLAGSGNESDRAAAIDVERPEAERALEAESWFRKGEAFLQAKQYDSAIEAFGMSAHFDPSEGEYIASLGYALYLSKPDDEVTRKESLEDIARGIKLSPDRDTPYIYLGRIFKVMGELDTARKMFSRALAIRPDCRPAARELRLMDMREKKEGGLLKRLSRRLG